MRIGYLWEEIFMLYGYEKITKLDLIHREKKIAIELKNNWTSDNFSGKKFKFSCLKQYKQEHPDYEVIYGCINDIQSRDYINKDDVRVLTSDNLLNYIFGKDKDYIIETLRKLIKEYLEKAFNA